MHIRGLPSSRSNMHRWVSLALRVAHMYPTCHRCTKGISLKCGLIPIHLRWLELDHLDRPKPGTRERNTASECLTKQYVELYFHTKSNAEQLPIYPEQRSFKKFLATLLKCSEWCDICVHLVGHDLPHLIGCGKFSLWKDTTKDHQSKPFQNKVCWVYPTQFFLLSFFCHCGMLSFRYQHIVIWSVKVSLTTAWRFGMVLRLPTICENVACVASKIRDLFNFLIYHSFCRTR